MKLSEQLKDDHECGDFGQGLEGYSEKAKKLEDEIARLKTRRPLQESELIAKQAMKTAELEEELSQKNEVLRDIHGVLFNIGGILNDGCVNYTNEQLRPIARIDVALRCVDYFDDK